MNVDEIRTLYDFNRRATGRVLESVKSLSPDKFTRDLRTTVEPPGRPAVGAFLTHRRWPFSSPWQGTKVSSPA
jgi:uncharacterized damage-inducible protein DinB